MIDLWLVTDPVLPTLLSYGIIIALTASFIWIEWQRKTRQLSIRVICVMVMMLGVTGFLIRPRYQTTRSEEIILLTPDYSYAQADSLLHIYPKLKVFHSQGAEAYRNSVAVKSYHDVSHELANIKFILGHGLPPEAFDLFPSHNYQFIAAPYPAGVVGLALPDNIVQNRPSTIDGVFNNPSEKESKLILSGPGGKEDSVTFSKHGLQSFRLSFIPREDGRFLYTLQSEDMVVGKLPVHVREERQLRILFIQHYPTFETRYLKEYLSKNHSLLLRYQLSRNKFRYESINLQAGNINRLTTTALSEFDLLVIDTDALRSLRASEMSSVRSAIEEGLGLLPFFNTPPDKTNEFVPFDFKSYASDTAHVFLSGGKHNVLPALRLNVAVEGHINPIIKNRDRILSAYQHRGFGKIGFQLFQQTYRLMLQGDSLAYAALWSTVLENISRTHIEPSTVCQQNENFPLYADAPAQIEIISSANEPDIRVNDVKIPARENILVDDLWVAKFWTDREGWNHISVGGDTVLDIYTSNKNEWRSLAIAHATESTLLAASSTRREKKLTGIFLPVPYWIFYLLFLAGAGFLWLSPKL